MRFVDAAPGAAAPLEGERLPLSGSFCARVLDGRFPTLIPDARAVPEAGLLDVTSQLHIGSCVGVPLMGPQGLAVGMLCAVNDTASPAMGERDVAALQLLASLLREVQDRALTDAQAVAERDTLRRALREVVSGAGRHAVLQPIVELATGRVVAAEGLTRFTTTSLLPGDIGQLRSPAQWFDDAARLGLRQDLELATAAAVLDLLDTVPAHTALTINLGPESILGSGLHDLLADRPLERIVIELSEHAPVQDYERLADALCAYRSAGVQLAVDDAGAGYASLRHVLAVRPDLLKIDMALTRGADVDLARRTLLHALADFGRATGCRLVAEGDRDRAGARRGRRLRRGAGAGLLPRPPERAAVVDGLPGDRLVRVRGLRQPRESVTPSSGTGEEVEDGVRRRGGAAARLRRRAGWPPAPGTGRADLLAAGRTPSPCHARMPDG